MASIIIPEVKLDERLQEGAGELYRQWRSAKEATEEQFATPDIRFVHDPQWRARTISVQNAHDCFQPGGSWFWRGISIGMVAGDLAWWGMSLLRR